MNEQKKTLGDICLIAYYHADTNDNILRWTIGANAVAAEVRKEWEAEREVLKRLLDAEKMAYGDAVEQIKSFNKEVGNLKVRIENRNKAIDVLIAQIKQPPFKFEVGQTVWAKEGGTLTICNVLSITVFKDSVSYNLTDRNAFDGEMLTEPEAIEWIKAKGVKAQ